MPASRSASLAGSKSRASSNSRIGSPMVGTPASGSRGREGGHKVREDDFSPVVKEIAIRAKSFVRTTTIYDQPFPSSRSAGKQEFSWKTITQLVNAADDEEWKEAFQDLKHDPTTKKKLVTFVS